MHTAQGSVLEGSDPQIFWPQVAQATTFFLVCPLFDDHLHSQKETGTALEGTTHLKSQ